MKIKQSSGSTINNNRAHGTAPINGPKKGIILVMPTMTDIKAAKKTMSILLKTDN